MTPSFGQERGDNIEAQKAADSIILSMYAPSAVLLNEKFDIIEFRGVTMQFFEHGPGKASTNIFKLAHRDLVHSLRSALNQAQSTRRSVKREGLTITTGITTLTVSFEIVAINNLRESYYLVIFNQPRDGLAGGDQLPGKPGVPETADKNNLRIHQPEKETCPCLTCPGILEGEVRERIIALEDANANLSKRNHELEQFVFITSHDLQEPLRKILLFADMLESEQPGSGKIDTVLYLRKVKQSAIRMSDLIRALIAYSRLELGENAFLPVNLNQIVANVIEDFELLIKDKNARIEVSELPVIEAVPLQMNQLFYNLIGNALKFSGENGESRITIAAGKILESELNDLPSLPVGPSYYRIIVTDNGIGFNQAYADKLFVIFQRLDQKEKYEGTGIGLALCRKIMDIHKGEIQAFGIEHQGAAFHVIIPGTQQ